PRGGRRGPVRGAAIQPSLDRATPQVRGPAVVEQLPYLAEDQIAQAEMSEVAALPAQATADQRAEHEQETADRGRVEGHRARRRLEQREPERRVLGDVAVLERQRLVPQTAGLELGPRAGAVQSFRRATRSEEHTSELQSPDHLVCRLLLEKKNRT